MDGVGVLVGDERNSVVEETLHEPVPPHHLKHLPVHSYPRLFLLLLFLLFLLPLILLAFVTPRRLGLFCGFFVCSGTFDGKAFCWVGFVHAGQEILVLLVLLHLLQPDKVVVVVVAVGVVAVVVVAVVVVAVGVVVVMAVVVMAMVHQQFIQHQGVTGVVE